MTPALDFIAPLFVPGNRPDRFAKAAGSGADAIILDLEDAVPLQEKEAARRALRSDFTQLPVLVRINAPGSPFCKDDLSAVAALDIAAVIVPKAAPEPEFEKLAAGLAGRPTIVALVETVAGMAGARRLAGDASVGRLAFGSIDYSLDLGCAHSREALLSARSELVLASRLAGLPAPIDGVTTALDDPDLCESDARHARDLGFSGKLCIHPKQIESVFRGFAPDPEEVAWAEALVAATADGASAFRGAMVDRPVRMRAEGILARVARAKRR